MSKPKLHPDDFSVFQELMDSIDSGQKINLNTKKRMRAIRAVRLSLMECIKSECLEIKE